MLATFKPAPIRFELREAIERALTSRALATIVALLPSLAPAQQPLPVPKPPEPGGS
jgi:hypothetical protein